MTTILKIDNVHGHVPRGDAYLQARKILKYRQRGCTFMPAYQRGWDGYVRLCDEHGRYPAGLTDYLRERLERAGISVEVEDTRIRPEPNPIISDARLNVELMPHQIEAAATAVKAGRGVVFHPVAAGKSYVLVEIARQCGVGTLVLTHKKELLWQLFHTFQETMNIPGAVGIIGDGRWEPNWITISTFQSLHKAMKQGTTPEMRALIERWQCVLADECHVVSAKTFEGVMKRLPYAYYRFGCSATPFKIDDEETALKVTGWTGPVVSHYTSEDGVAFGRLVPANVFMVEPGGAEPSKLSWPDAYETGIVSHQSRNSLVTALAGRLSRRGPVLVLVTHIKHGERLYRELAEDGHRYHMAFISGRDSSKTRRLALDAFREGGLKILISSVILDEGVDLPGIHALILAGGGKARHRIIQRVGRGQRKTAGKDVLTVIDFLDAGKYLSKHARERAKVYRDDPSHTLTEIGYEEIQEWLT